MNRKISVVWGESTRDALKKSKKGLGQDVRHINVTMSGRWATWTYA